MIILLASQEDIKNEAQILNQLFEFGLECYHLSKPYKNHQEHTDFLNEIDSNYLNRIVLHNFHELTNEFDIKGIHFEEEIRRAYIETPTRYFKDLNLFGKTISSSFHELKELDASDFEFDYHILDLGTFSTSNPNHTVKEPDVNLIDKAIIAMGDINKNHIREILDLGFKGAVISKSIWESDEPVQSFIDLKAIYDTLIKL